MAGGVADRSVSWVSPADFAAGLQPCPPAALPFPQALGRFLQQTGLPPRLRPSQLALSFRRYTLFGREGLRRPLASYRLSVYVMEHRRRFILRLTGTGIISIYVTQRCSRPYRFGHGRRHFIYVTE
jgi:hypothetical protein